MLLTFSVMLHTTGNASAGQVNGVAPSMQAHLKKCTYLSDDQKAQAGVGSTASSAAGSSGSQQHFNPFLPLKDTSYTQSEQAELEQHFLRATVSANLPYVWVDDEHVITLPKFLKPSIVLPSRKKIADQSLKAHYMPMRMCVEPQQLRYQNIGIQMFSCNLECAYRQALGHRAQNPASGLQTSPAP